MHALVSLIEGVTLGSANHSEHVSDITADFFALRWFCNVAKCYANEGLEPSGVKSNEADQFVAWEQR